MPSIPKPFQRPSIDLGGHKREWADWPITELRSGDLIPDFGVLGPDSQLAVDGLFFHLYAVNALTGEKKDFSWTAADPTSNDNPIPTLWAFH